MTTADLLALSERYFIQLGVDFGVSDDGDAYFVTSEDDEAITVTAHEVESGSGEAWPVLSFFTGVFADVVEKSVDPWKLHDLSAKLGFGSIVYDRDEAAIGVHHECVGWPGGVEYTVAIECLVGAAQAVREELEGSIKAAPSPAYSEIVS